MIRINANLFRIAYACVSTEDTRYYLGGVFIEPHAKGGVLLVATDGHRMVCIHDETGRADESAIIKLQKDALKHCKPIRGDRRELVLEADSQTATIRQVFGPADEPEYKPLATAFDVRIDGTFPDYRRVVPTKFKGEEVPAFNGQLLGSFGDIGAALADSRTCPPMLVSAEDHSSPALVLWPSCPMAFGVIMPMRAATYDLALPAWFADKPAQSIAA